MPENNVECPVDFILINERKARLTAASVFILTLFYLVTKLWAIPAFLMVDFFLRSYNVGRYSPMNFISDQLVRIFSIGTKPVDQAPKRFAAKIGLFFSISIVASLAFKFTTLSLLLALVVAIFALLESSVGFCAGCHAYSFYLRFIKKKNAVLSALFIIAGLFFLQAAQAQPAKTETSFTIENYYKTKWGFADEFIHLWKLNHYPLLKKAVEKGDIISVTAEKPKLHSGEDTR